MFSKITWLINGKFMVLNDIEATVNDIQTTYNHDVKQHWNIYKEGRNNRNGAS